MKKIYSLLLITFITTSLVAQTIDDIKDLISKAQWDKAKTSIDAFLLKEKNAIKWEGWYYKGIIYNEIAKSETYSAQYPDARMTSFAAFKKYYEVDTKAIQATLEQNVRLFEIYSNYFDLAAQNFNKKDYAEALNNFKNAHIVESFIASKGFDYNNFTFPEFDTTLIQNIALAAFMAKKEDEAAIYYTKITDRKIGGKGNEDGYQFLVDYHSKKGDLQNRSKYLQLGNEIYPEDDFWYLTELGEIENEKDKKKIFAKYEELIPKYPNKQVLQYNYAVELFNYAYTSEVKPVEYKEIQKKLEQRIKTILEKKPDYVEANILLAKHFYNLAFDIQDEQRLVKGTKPEDLKKKAEYKALVSSTCDEIIHYGLIAFNYFNSKASNGFSKLKTSEKGSFKMIADLLTSAYEMKGDNVKAEEYKKKQESIQ